MQELTTIDDILQLGKFDTWTQTGGAEYHITQLGSKPDAVRCTVSLATLESMHPRIPAALEALGKLTAMQHYPVGEPFAIHKDVLSTLLYYTGRTVSYSTLRGEMLVMSDITSLTRTKWTDNEVEIKGTLLKVINPSGDWNPTFVVQDAIDTFLTTVEEIESRYPGCLVKWKLGEELGVDSASLMQNAFFGAAPLAVSPWLTSVTFE